MRIQGHAESRCIKRTRERVTKETGAFEVETKMECQGNKDDVAMQVSRVWEPKAEKRVGEDVPT